MTTKKLGNITYIMDSDKKTLHVSSEVEIDLVAHKVQNGKMNMLIVSTYSK